MIRLKTKDFDLAQTLECGQVFRFQKIASNAYYLQTQNIVAKIWQQDDDLFIESTIEDINFWINYFDLNTDYAKIKNIISRDEKMKEIISYGEGIHILRQSFEEMLISFIMSQNKQIPQIKQCIELFCKKFGEKITFQNKTFYTFPCLNFIPTLEQLRECKVGFRDKYILDALEKYKLGYFKNIESKSEQEQEELLLDIKGIGTKVANCILLFSLQRTDRFPIDVQIKHQMQNLYFNYKETPNKIIQEKAEELFGEYQGYAQQYMYYYALKQKKKKT